MSDPHFDSSDPRHAGWQARLVGLRAVYTAHSIGDARAVLARAQAAELALADLSGLRCGTLAVRASQTIASHWLPRHLVAFRAAYPDIVLRLGIGNTAEAAEAVRAGTAERIDQF